MKNTLEPTEDAENSMGRTWDQRQCSRDNGNKKDTYA